MKNLHYLLALAFMTMLAIPMSAQVSNDNEDGVYKIARPQVKDFVPGQVLFKLKEGNEAKVRRAAGRVQSAGISSLDAVLKEYTIEEMEQLLPNAKVKGAPRRAKTFSGETIVERDLTQLYKVTLSEENAHETLQLIEKLKPLPEVEFAEPNYKMYMMADDHIADSYSGNGFATQQWYLDAYGVKELWNKPIINPKRPVIAIIDTGVDMTHPDIAPNLWINQAEAEGEEDYDNDGNGFAGDVHGWDFINNTPNVRDFNMHGTHVAGIAAANNNNIGIVGANPRALIMPVSVLQSDGTGDVATVIKGINYATQNGADVLNLSLGTYAYSNALRLTLERTYQNAVIVAAAGNDGFPVDPDCGPDRPSFPAAFSFVLGVQATNESGSLAGFSNYDCNGPNYSAISTYQDIDGFNYELKAPGTNILSTIPGGKYKVLQGTSMASPLVAGAISALKMVKEYDTQEILWGDLTHTDNIAQAYAVKDRPAELEILRQQLQDRKNLEDETEEDYGGDHEIDAGELVSVYPVIRTTFGAASNIKMHLEMGDEFEDPTLVQFMTGIVDFGMRLDGYGRGVSLNPLVLKVADNVADNRHIKLKIVVTCDESTKTYERPFTIVVTNMVKISGLVSENMTLTADHTYLVNETVGIMEGATLTIEPGTRLEFMGNTGLTSFGKLVANGTPEKPIIFTKHVGESGGWNGIKSHAGTNAVQSGNGAMYTNDEHTLFTLVPTEQTPNWIDGYETRHFYTKYAGQAKWFSLSDYMIQTVYHLDMTYHQELLTDPNFLSPAINQLLADFEAYVSQFPTEYSEEYPNYNYSRADFTYYWNVYENPRDMISYCRLDGFNSLSANPPYMYDCDINFINNSSGWISPLEGERMVLHDASSMSGEFSHNLRYTNIVNNILNGKYNLPRYSELHLNNYFNSKTFNNESGKYYGKEYWLGHEGETPEIDKSLYPSYLGSSREEIVRPYVYEIGNALNTFLQVDLSNMRTTPIPEAHGIVWKVVVNGKDAQDEYEDLAPLGVGRHKFEVYFNRPMNKTVAPQITFGIRDPYTQNSVNEDGSWNEEGTVYTAYKTITGKTKSDGVNQIYIWGAEDNEFFECPYEKTRFKITIQAAGSMATGFAAEPGLGKVSLTWNNENNNFDDAMGFNIYRFSPEEKRTIPAHYDENWDWIEEAQVVDTLCINKEIVDIETTEYTDYDVTPGITYYYMYKVLSTDLKEYDVSNIVAATPLTATLGDANGSGDVDVADVITTVNYAAGLEPKPFIFEAADINADLSIDILDVVGIIQKILNPSASPVLTMAEATAVYTVENGVLYVETPVALAGVQVQVNWDVRSKMEDVKVADNLDGFEHTSAWLSDNDYLFLAFNMNGKTLSAGKHALLYVDDADLSSLRLSDIQGRNVMVEAGEGVTGIDAMGSKVMKQEGIYDLQGRKLSTLNSKLSTLKKGVYIINGEKVVK